MTAKDRTCRFIAIERMAAIGASCPVSARPGEGHLTESMADVQPARRELVLMPQSGHCARSVDRGRIGSGPSSSAQCRELPYCLSLFAAPAIRTKRLSEHHYRIGMPPLSMVPPPISRTV